MEIVGDPSPISGIILSQCTSLGLILRGWSVESGRVGGGPAAAALPAAKTAPSRMPGIRRSDALIRVPLSVCAQSRARKGSPALVNERPIYTHSSDGQTLVPRSPSAATVVFYVGCHER